MKKLLFTVALFISINSFAQSSGTPPPNANELAMIEMQKKGYFGNFAYLIDEIHQINVNYSFTPKVPTNEVKFIFHTPEPRPLSLAIKDHTGKVVMTWQPTEDTYIKEGSLDVSKLKKGKYTYVILWDNNEAHEIDFEKN